MFTLVYKFTHSVQALLLPTKSNSNDNLGDWRLPNQRVSVAHANAGAMRIARLRPLRVSAKEISTRFNAEPQKLTPASTLEAAWNWQVERQPSISSETRVLRVQQAGLVACSSESRARAMEVKQALTNILVSARTGV